MRLKIDQKGFNGPKMTKKRSKMASVCLSSLFCNLNQADPESQFFPHFLSHARQLKVLQAESSFHIPFEKKYIFVASFSLVPNKKSFKVSEDFVGARVAILPQSPGNRVDAFVASFLVEER